MKRLNRMLLIHWYTYEQEVVEFGNINFLTGKTASGKSTIIDALQLVLLGDTNGNFFNKAANEKSVRTLKSYLFGENGDDGETGFRYLRPCTFTSYVILEFEDTQKHSSFLTGIVCDCFEDLHFEYKWLIVDRMRIPEDLFTDVKTRTPYTIVQFRSYLRRQGTKSFDLIDTNRRYQELLLAKFGALKRKYLVLLKKAVPFSPISDIEQFITESICDIRNNIQVEQMQSDIRQYKDLEAEAIRTQAKVKDLTEIAKASRAYEADQDRYHQQSYIILRADQEERREKGLRLRQQEGQYQKEIQIFTEKLARLEADRKRLETEIDTLQEEYNTSDLAKKQKALEQGIHELKEQINRLTDALRKVEKQLQEYGRNWTRQLERLVPAPEGLGEAEREFFLSLQELTQDSLKNFDFGASADRMEQILDTVKKYEYELYMRAGQLRQTIDELNARIENLKKGIKPYPRQVTALKHALESKLFSKYKRTVEIPIFAELLEIRDASWRDAIEGYLDQQRFYLLVPAEYFRAANEIYDAVKKEERIYDVGIVDIAKLRKEFRKAPMPGSLAEEIETEHPDARLYADYLLGNVMKCEDVRELNRYHTAITKSVMLYKGYVSRRLNPVRYADPFIGRRSLEILLANLMKERESANREYEQTANTHRLAKVAAACPIMNLYEAKQHESTVREAGAIPEMMDTLAVLNAEYEGLDFTWLEKLKSRIAEKKEERDNNIADQKKASGEKQKAEYRLEQLVTKELPLLLQELAEVEKEIGEQFEASWIEETGEPRFQKELRQREHRDQGMTLRESFTRARNQTRTTMEKDRAERTRRRALYNQEYRMPFDTLREDNREYDDELHTLADIRLPEYIGKIRDAKEKAYNQFRDDFIAKLKSNIESVREQINELNHSLKDSVFGTDRYRFVMSPRAEYRNYYEMITDPMLMDTGGWNIASQHFNEKYQKEIDSLFRALIINNEAELSAERRAEYERNIKKFTDYKTYLVFDLIVTNDQGEEQRLSKTLLKKSGGETQIPFYIALLASFSQICRIRARTNNNTVRIIILDEAFSKMDGERIKEGITLLRRFGLQAVFSAPPEKIPDIAPMVDTNIAVYKSGHTSFTRHFDPAQIEEIAGDMEE
ncbi:MAG: hypothetical protein IKE58_09830 [Blautia sp.]|nr:hypothetical protein [Blautia sp.]